MNNKSRTKEKIISKSIDSPQHLTLFHSKSIHQKKIIKGNFPFERNEKIQSNTINSINIKEKKNNEINKNNYMIINEIFHVHQIEILSLKKNYSMYEKLFKEEKQRNNSLIEKEKVYNKKINSMLQELNKKDLLIEKLRIEIFKYEKYLNRNNENQNEIEKVILKLEKRNKKLNSKINDFFSMTSIDKVKFQIEKFSFNLEGSNNKKQILDLNKKVEELSEEKKSLLLKKIKYRKDLRNKDNKLNIYENQISYISNSFNDLIIKNGDLEKEKYDLENIIFKQEDKISHLNNKIGEFNLVLKEKNKEMVESKLYFKKLIDKYKIMNNEKLNYIQNKGKTLLKEKNSLNNSLINSFDNNLDYGKTQRIKFNFPSIKSNYFNKEFNVNESSLKRNKSDLFRKSLYEKTNLILEQKEKENIQDIKNMINTIVDKFE